MLKLSRIFLQTPLLKNKHGWSIEFRDYLSARKDDEGNKLFQARARNPNRMRREMMQFSIKCGCLLWIVATF
ncbi:hypothetical protein [Microcoleus vaginatus]|uniref:hypothetical protein n=1 Tax=Microcoleus vaginatus TaxID=119532 RepID=UPI001F6169EE|nr:hypothetical protein D0A37_23270 [Microcoleus vaginatus HSN003]